MAGKDIELCELEQNQVTKAFQRKDYHFLGGRTGGYYGPYIWRTTESKTFELELPEAIQSYTVKLLDGFLSNSWADYLSFGELGTGGWTDSDGIINCVKASYDLDSENFKVSLLEQFAREADASDGSNGHSAASGRIMNGFAQKLGLAHSEIEKLPLGQVQTAARTLFDESA